MIIYTVFFRDLAPYEASCANARAHVKGKWNLFPRSVLARVLGRVFATVL